MQFERTRKLSNFVVALHYLHDMFVHVFLKNYLDHFFFFLKSCVQFGGAAYFTSVAYTHVFLKITLIISFFSWNHVCNLGVLLILQVWLIHMFSIFLRRTVGKQSYQLLYHSTSHQFLVSKSVIRTVSQTINQSELYLKFKQL